MLLFILHIKKRKMINNIYYDKKSTESNTSFNTLDRELSIRKNNQAKKIHILKQIEITLKIL